MKCCICGNEFAKSNWTKPYDDICSSECFKEKLWRIREEEHQQEPRIIIDHVLYSDAGDKPNASYIESKWLGHAGHRFNILMDDGTKVSTNNLWCGGDIPESHRDVLCDNAKFIKD